MRNTRRLLVAATLWVVLGTPLAAYTIILKDGSQLIAQEAPSIEGDQAIIVLQSGARTSLAADEIDLERTRAANLHALGSAVILEDGQITSATAMTGPAREERLSDLINKRRRSQGATPRTAFARESSKPSRSAPNELSSRERMPYRDLPVLEAIQGAFRSQDVDTVKIYQGTSGERLLIEIETNSEAAVFRSIKVAAGALSHVRTNISATIEAFELVLTTSNRSRAGEFLMTTEQAARIVSGEVEISSYFIAQVEF